MFRWFFPSTFFFARHQHDTLSSLAPETRDVVAARDSGDRIVQSTEPDIVNGLICARICAGADSSPVVFITRAREWDDPMKTTGDESGAGVILFATPC